MEMAMASQIDVFHECFDQVGDPRVAGRTIHPLNSILFLVVSAVIAGADGPDEIESFGGEKLDWLSKFADFEAGIPSHDTITRVLSLIQPAEFQKALLQWHAHLCEINWDHASKDDNRPVHVAIDGKTVRGSYTDAEKSDAIHIVSAWATENGVTLGQTEVDSKSNEITAIPELLDLIDLRNSIVTLDAMGCQKSIAEKIVEGGGDYLFAVKDNHPKLCAAIAEHFEMAHNDGLTAHGVRAMTTTGKQAAREEERFYATCPIPKALRELTDQWKGAKSICQANTCTTRGDRQSSDVRYYISSRPARVHEFSNCARSHWSIESMHWVLDVVFHEDSSRLRTKNATSNMSFARRFVTTLLKRDTRKKSLRRKRKIAGWNTEFLEKLLFAA
ncbi:ISAs1 family transposase [Novipirellula sp.]|uniref:ISAs1 family transposase n=1 Tax=Novipirellula sp. TaxID=2795430 RepID=UPI003565572B